MAFVTRLRLTSGNRETLEQVVSDLKVTAERKGIKLTGPHSKPPEEFTVPQYRRSPPGAVQPLERDPGADGTDTGDGGEAATAAADGADGAVVDTADGTFPPWRYTVYAREMEIVGREEFVRDIAAREFPESIRVEVEVSQRTGTGS